MSDNHIGIYLDLFGGDKAQRDLKAVGQGLSGLGPASQAGARMATQQLGSMQMSAKQTAAALRGVPAQFTDIVVSLSSGQQPLTVLLQQGGQLKDMFGGVGAAARALGGYVVGLISPLTLLAGGIAAVGVAYYQGSKEQDAFNRSIIMSGNLAGVTAGQLANLAKSLGAQGYSQSGAAEALAKLVETGKVGREHLEQFAAVAMDLEKRAGIPIANTVENMAALGKEPVQASIRLNEQYGYLTTATLAQVKAAEEEGRAADAASIAQDAYAKAMAGRTKDLTSNLGYIQRAWEGIKSAASGAWNAMLNVGRPETEDDVLKRLRNQLAVRKAQAPTVGDDAAWKAGNAKLEGQIANLEKALSTKNGNAQQAAANQGIQNDANKSLQNIDKAFNSFRSKSEAAADELKEFRIDIQKVRNALNDPSLTKEQRENLEKRLDPKRIADTEAAILKKGKESGSGRGAQAIQTADRRLDLSELQNAMRQEQAMIGQQQQQLEISRAAGLLSLEDYYAQKRALIEKNSAVEESAIKQQIERLESEKTKGADAINVQKQLTDLRGKLAVRQIQTQNELADADQKSAKALQQHSAAMAQLTTNTAAYIQQLQARADLQVAGVGMGQQRNQYESGLLSIRENYAQQIRGLEDQRGTASNWTKENEDYFQERVRLLKQQQEEEVRIYTETFDRVTAAQGLWQNGAIRAMEDYLSTTRNVAQQTADAFANAFRGMEDALVSFATTGKMDFKSMANSIIGDIVRIQARSAISGLFGSLLGGNAAGNAGWGDYSSAGLAAAFGGKRATGGPVSAGKMYEVNERGMPELLNVGGRQMLMMAGQSGYVTPLGGSSGSGAVGGGVVVNIHNNAGATVEQRSSRGSNGLEVIDVFINQAVNAVAGQLSSDSGAIGQAMRARTQMGM